MHCFFKISYQKRIWLSNITIGQLNQAEHFCQTPGLDLGIRVDFVLPLSQEEQQQIEEQQQQEEEQEQEPQSKSRRVKFDT